MNSTHRFSFPPERRKSNENRNQLFISGICFFGKRYRMMLDHAMFWSNSFIFYSILILSFFQILWNLSLWSTKLSFRPILDGDATVSFFFVRFKKSLFSANVSVSLTATTFRDKCNFFLKIIYGMKETKKYFRDLLKNCCARVSPLSACQVPLFKKTTKICLKNYSKGKQILFRVRHTATVKKRGKRFDI